MPGAGPGAVPARTGGGLRVVKMTLALTASVLGALMPWRIRVLYSELLGWIAQLVPPDLYRMDGEEGPPGSPAAPGPPDLPGSVDPADTRGDRG